MEQVRILAILMIVLGSLELFGGLLGVAIGVFGYFVGGPDEPDTIFVIVFYGALGLIFLLVGAVRLVAGIQALKFRAWMLGLISHFLGGLTLLTCQCAVLAVGLGIFGLIVYFQPSVKQAFEMRKNGQSPEKIIAYFRKSQIPY